jgi:type II secretory pathway component PulK
MHKKGAALLLAIFSLIIISLLVTAFLELTTIDLQIISNHLMRNQALYIADAGIEYAISQLRINKNWKQTLRPIELPVGSGNTYDVTYSSVSGKINSMAKLASGQEITLEAKVSVKTGTPAYAVKIIYWREL